MTHSAYLYLLLKSGVGFSFSSDSYGVHEAGVDGSRSFLPIRVFKNGRIASRVELVVVPLMVQEARATSLPLPPNVPEDDMNSPPFASKKV